MSFSNAYVERSTDVLAAALETKARPESCQLCHSSRSKIERKHSKIKPLPSSARCPNGHTGRDQSQSVKLVRARSHVVWDPEPRQGNSAEGLPRGELPAP